MFADFSLITCTYNPDERILARCVASLKQLDTNGINAEFIIVDNNSSTPVRAMTCIRSLEDARFQVIEQPKAGLAHARIAGAKQARSGVLIFVDDDNELAADYLQGLKSLLENYPFVGVWGAGCIEVDLIDGAAAWVRKYLMTQFQQRRMLFTQFGCVVGWPEYYPVGSGLIVKKNIFEQYLQLFEQGMLSATDRTGNSLASAGDSQIVWTATRSGIPAGTSPLLKLTHIIPERRTTTEYLKRLNYNLALSYYKALHEMFPKIDKQEYQRGWLHKLDLVLRNTIKTKGDLYSAYKLTQVALAWDQGSEKALKSLP
jgi:glycosyltransferase involved in cell wall biosynthesis